jgi:hypothetical protein
MAAPPRPIASRRMDHNHTMMNIGIDLRPIDGFFFALPLNAPFLFINIVLPFFLEQCEIIENGHSIGTIIQ